MSRRREKYRAINKIENENVNRLLYPLIVVMLLITIIIYVQNIIVGWNTLQDNYNNNVRMVTDMSRNMSSNMGIITNLFEDEATKAGNNLLQSIQSYEEAAGSDMTNVDLERFLDATQDVWIDINILKNGDDYALLNSKEGLSGNAFKFSNISGAEDLAKAFFSNSELAGTWVTISTQTDVVVKHLYYISGNNAYIVQVVLNLANFNSSLKIYDFESYANDLVRNFAIVDSAIVYNTDGKSTSLYEGGEALWINNADQSIFDKVGAGGTEITEENNGVLGYKNTKWGIPIKVSLANEDKVYENYIFIVNFSNADEVSYFYVQAGINLLITLISLTIIIIIITRNTKQYLIPLQRLTESIEATASGDYNKPAFVQGAPFMRATIIKFNILIKRIEEAIRMKDEAYFETIDALVSALDASDPYTAGHCSRVMKMSLLLADKIGLPKDQRKTLKIGALFHDIGKIGIDNQIVNKPSRLSDEEFAQVKMHPTIGLKIIGRIKHLHDMQKLTVEHHERWDGKGYPQGLKGDEIQLLSRITALADAYDAMSSNRSYRKAMPAEVIIAEIERNAGTQFDPELVKPFIAVIREIDGQDLNELDIQ